MRNVVAMILLGVCVAFAAPACSGLAKSQTEQLRDEVTRFNDNVRWGRYRAASVQIPDQRRDVWVTSMERAGRAFRILEYEVRPQVVDGDIAVVVVDMVYHPIHDVVIQRVRRRQVWKKGGSWYLASEHQVTPQRMPPPDMFPEFGDTTQSANAQ